MPTRLAHQTYMVTGAVKSAKGLRILNRAGLPGQHTSEEVAGVTGLEPATSGVTGRHSNQLSYTPAGRPKTEELPNARARGCQRRFAGRFPSGADKTSSPAGRASVIAFYGSYNTQLGGEPQFSIGAS